MKLVCVPKGIYLRLDTFSNGLYSLILQGWTKAAERVVIHDLCLRCNKSMKSIRRLITEGKRLGWIQSCRDFDGVTKYTRHAPGPYVDVVSTDSIDVSGVAHKLLILCQLNSRFCHIDFCKLHLSYSRSSIYLGFKALSDLNLYSYEDSTLTKDILSRSLRASTLPVSKPRAGKKLLAEQYDSWVAEGKPSLDLSDVTYASQVLCQHFKTLCLSVENINVNITSSRVADVVEVLRWLSCDPSVPLEDSEKLRLNNITSGSPFDTAILAVESLFTKYFSGFTYDFHVLFKISETKNHFDRFVLGTYLKARKNPNWRQSLQRKLDVDTPNNESYDEFKQRLLSSRHKLGPNNGE